MENKIKILQRLTAKVYNAGRKRQGILFWISGSSMTLYVWRKNPYEDPEAYTINRRPESADEADEAERVFQAAKERLCEILIDTQMP